MIYKNKQAFTLVELIVVITILAILGTIAFISLQGYSKSARDSKRVADIQNIKKSLELFSLNTGKYPVPDEGYDAKYNTETIWTQGTVGTIVQTNLSKNLNSVPLDPLTESEYTYSVTNKKTEYEVLSIYESDLVSYNNVLNQAQAETLYPKIEGTYDGVVVITPNYIVPTPSIINSEINGSGITLNDDNIKSQITTGGNNLLANGVTISSTGGLNGFSLEVYEGGIDTLTGTTSKELLATNIQTAYSDTILAEDAFYKTILSAETLEEKLSMVDQIVFNEITTYTPLFSPSAFVSKWDVGIDTGVSGFNNLELPLQSDGTYNFTVDWGDGTSNTITSYNQAEATHNYGTGGIYDVIIEGQIDGFAFNGVCTTDNIHDGDKLIDIKQWGNLKLSNSGEQFGNVENLVIFSANDSPDLTGITNMSKMFCFATNFNANINSWDVSNVLNMQQMFQHSLNFNQNLNLWNTSNVTNMMQMFGYAQKFNGDITTWETGNVTDMRNMFYVASKFNQNIGNWDVSKANIFGMFDTATDFNGDISQWILKPTLTSLLNLFRSAQNFNQDISGWNISNVTNMSETFRSAVKFNQDISGWNINKVTNMTQTFKSAIEFNQDLTGWSGSLNQVSSCIQFSYGANLWDSFNKPILPNCTE